MPDLVLGRILRLAIANSFRARIVYRLSETLGTRPVIAARSHLRDCSIQGMWEPNHDPRKIRRIMPAFDRCVG